MLNKKLKTHILITAMVLTSLVVPAIAAEEINDAVQQEAAPIEVKKEKTNFFSKLKLKKQQKKELTEFEPSEPIASEEELQPKDTAKEEPKQKEKTSLFSKLKFKKAAEPIQEAEPEKISTVNIDSDTLEYFPDRKEFEALGNAKIIFTDSNSTLAADKIIFNHDLNVIKGYGDVKLIRDGNVIDGDFIQVNLNDEDNALITNPISVNDKIEIQALRGYIYSDKVETDAGVAKIKENGVFFLRTSSIGSFISPRSDFLRRKGEVDKMFQDKYKIKANKIIIERKDDHDSVSMRPSHIYYNGHRVMRAGDVKIVTNKYQDFAEIDGIELGSMSQLGMYLGYGYVFNVPGGATLKLAPTLNLYGSQFGVGGIAKFKSPTNLTEFAFSTANNKGILSGSQDLTEDLKIQYGLNSYMDEWFLGGRIFEYSAQLVHDKSYYLKDIDVNYRQRTSAGFFQDYERRFSTPRVRWQAEASKNIFHYATEDKDYGVDLALVGQVSTALYGTGDTQFIARVGPSLRTQVKRWTQVLTYYTGGMHDGTPLRGDQYMYGRHSINLFESLRLSKYVALGYSATIVPLKDNWQNKFLAENSFSIILGPDEMRMLLAYDTVRQRTQFSMEFLLGAKNTNVEYKKLIVKDPNKAGKKRPKKKSKDEIQEVNDTKTNQELDDIDDTTL